MKEVFISGLAKVATLTYNVITLTTAFPKGTHLPLHRIFFPALLGHSPRPAGLLLPV